MPRPGGKVPTGKAPDKAVPPEGVSKPDKLKPRAIDDKDGRAARAATYAARMGVQRATEPADPTPSWLRALIDAAEKPARRNPQLAAALNGVPAKYRPTTTDPKDTR